MKVTVIPLLVGSLKTIAKILENDYKQTDHPILYRRPDLLLTKKKKKNQKTKTNKKTKQNKTKKKTRTKQNQKTKKPKHPPPKKNNKQPCRLMYLPFHQTTEGK